MYKRVVSLFVVLVLAVLSACSALLIVPETEAELMHTFARDASYAQVYNTRDYEYAVVFNSCQYDETLTSENEWNSSLLSINVTDYQEKEVVTVENGLITAICYANDNYIVGVAERTGLQTSFYLQRYSAHGELVWEKELSQQIASISCYENEISVCSATWVSEGEDTSWVSMYTFDGLLVAEHCFEDMFVFECIHFDGAYVALGLENNRTRGVGNDCHVLRINQNGEYDDLVIKNDFGAQSMASINNDLYIYGNSQEKGSYQCLKFRSFEKQPDIIVDTNSVAKDFRTEDCDFGTKHFAICDECIVLAGVSFQRANKEHSYRMTLDVFSLEGDCLSRYFIPVTANPSVEYVKIYSEEIIVFHRFVSKEREYEMEIMSIPLQ